MYFISLSEMTRSFRFKKLRFETVCRQNNSLFDDIWVSINENQQERHQYLKCYAKQSY